MTKIVLQPVRRLMAPVKGTTSSQYSISRVPARLQHTGSRAKIPACAAMMAIATSPWLRSVLLRVLIPSNGLCSGVSARKGAGKRVPNLSPCSRDTSLVECPPLSSVFGDRVVCLLLSHVSASCAHLRKHSGWTLVHPASTLQLGSDTRR